jgi:hypothetical protein
MDASARRLANLAGQLGQQSAVAPQVRGDEREAGARTKSLSRWRPAFSMVSLSSPHAQFSPAPASASTPPTPGFKVALLGAAGGIGQPLGMLLKM